jgi:hypothetical protein
VRELDTNGVYIENIKIDFVDEFKYVRVILDSSLNFNAHVNFVAKKLVRRYITLAELVNICQLGQKLHCIKH